MECGLGRSPGHPHLVVQAPCLLHGILDEPQVRSPDGDREDRQAVARAKAGSDAEDEKLLGHEDPKMLNRVYKRNAVKVTPVKPRNI